MGRAKGSKNGSSSVVPYKDYNLIVRIKNGDRNAEIELFNEYKELIYQQYHKLKEIKYENNFKGLEVPSIEDYVADAWEPFVSAVNTTDTSKITKVPIYDKEDEAKHKEAQEKSKALYKRKKALEADPKHDEAELQKVKADYKAAEIVRKEVKANRRIIGYTDNRSKWCFYQTLWGYLKKKNEVMVAHYIKDSKNTVPTTISIDDNDDFDITDISSVATSMSPEDELFKNIEQTASREAMDKLTFGGLTQTERVIWNSKIDGKTDDAIMKEYKISSMEYKLAVNRMWLKYQNEFKKAYDNLLF